MAFEVYWDDGKAHSLNWLFENSAVIHSVVRIDDDKIFTVFPSTVARKYEGDCGVILGGDWDTRMHKNGEVSYRFSLASLCFPFWEHFS